jgi:hypothetical protein
MKDSLLLAIITTVPAIAWFINAFIHSIKWYINNKQQIKTVAQVHVENVKEGAVEIKSQVEQKIHDKTDTTKL